MKSNAFTLMPTGKKPGELQLSSDTREQVSQIIAAFTTSTPGEISPRLIKKIKPGMAVLFYGPAGTGKSQAAAAIGKEIGSAVYRVELSAVLSKYIGETEKNLDRLCKRAAEKKAILFFDEADALFGKRSEVKDAHDRYANLEVDYLLRKAADHEVPVILAVKTKANIDTVFLRRLYAVIQF